MATNLPVDVIRKQDWLEPIADRLQPTIAEALGAEGSIGPKVADILHGTWLGHPLHVVLTDVPLGSWTAAAVLDMLEEMTGSTVIGRGADAAITVGLVGAAGAAITGLADWSEIGGGQPRRIGLAHGLLNATATPGANTFAIVAAGVLKDAAPAGGKCACAAFAVWVATAAATRAMSYPGATRPKVRPRQSAHSPMAKMSGSLVRQ